MTTPNVIENTFEITDKEEMKLPKEILDWINTLNNEQKFLVIATLLQEKEKHTGTKGLQAFINQMQAEFK